jgi:hypothetical protein
VLDNSEKLIFGLLILHLFLLLLSLDLCKPKPLGMLYCVEEILLSLLILMLLVSFCNLDKAICMILNLSQGYKQLVLGSKVFILGDQGRLLYYFALGELVDVYALCSVQEQ